MFRDVRLRRFGELHQLYGGIQAIPTTFYIDREGNVAGQHQGDSDKAAFEAAIKPLLAKSAGANL